MQKNSKFLVCLVYFIAEKGISIFIIRLLVTTAGENSNAKTIKWQKKQIKSTGKQKLAIFNDSYLLVRIASFKGWIMSKWETEEVIVSLSRFNVGELAV